MISAISDTANWVAWYRSLETSRPDPLFRDPFAESLAGTRGKAIAQRMRGLRDSAGIVAVRTMLIDQIIADCVAHRGIDTVLNLACGFDTRPFRLDLPARLRWFDVDGPTIISQKQAVLEGASPRCAWQTLVADLADATARREALNRALQGAERALVLTEGLLLYLHESQVRELATDLAAQPACTVWITDLLSAQGRHRADQIFKGAFADSQISVQFGPVDGAGFFSQLGFAEVDARSTIQEAYKLRRLPLLYHWIFTLAQLSQRARATLVGSSRVVCMERR